MSIASKIYKREDLIPIIEKLRKQGKTVGVTNGAFDLLHAGHVQYLEDAKKQCDILVVSVNTDESVRLYKDANRPITPEEDRARIIAGLQSVDFVTFHSERRMRDTLLAFKPNFYIKGGDYNPEKLTSKDVLDAWGGEVRFIPLLPGRSTSSIIERIISRYCNKPVCLETAIPQEKQKIVVLDRDGVIAEDVAYLHEENKFVFAKGVFDGLKKLQDAGFLLVIVTNQPGIGFGYYTKEDFFKLNKYMLSELHKYGISISKIYFCPHTQADNCACRKPGSALLERAKEELHADVEKSWMIGDRETDIIAGEKAGFATIRIGSRATNFSEAVAIIVKNSQ